MPAADGAAFIDPLRESFDLGCRWTLDALRPWNRGAGYTVGKGIMPTHHFDSDSSPAHTAVTARLHEARALVVVRIAAMDEDMAALVAASRDSNADDEHDPEGQTIAYERSQLSALTTAARNQLRELDAAVERVAAGTYGVCEVCGGSIGAERLEARPTARTCVVHAGGHAGGPR
jgi:RNA polymerase-binding transcription factor DksA